MNYENSSNTVHLHRVLRAPASRIYKAFLDPDALVKWLPPHGFVGKVHAFDGRVGGGYHMSFTNLGTGSSHSFRAVYKALVENERLELSDQFDDPNLPGQMSVVVSLKEVACGTELRVEQSGIPPQIPVEFCTLGWQESLALLAQLTEAEIPDEPAP